MRAMHERCKDLGNSVPGDTNKAKRDAPEVHGERVVMLGADTDSWDRQQDHAAAACSLFYPCLLTYCSLNVQMVQY